MNKELGVEFDGNGHPVTFFPKEAGSITVLPGDSLSITYTLTYVEEKKPIKCPFCGRIEVVFQRKIGGYRVSCAVCGGSGPFQETERDAITAWNRRTDADVRSEDR